MADTPTQTYNGNCHCGAVKYTLTHAPLTGPSAAEVTSCNCSICIRNGYLLVYPKKSDFKLLQGDEKLVGYEFAGKNVVHRFCGVCGTSVLGYPHEWDIVAVNVRTFGGVDVEGLRVKRVDMASVGEKYEV